MGDLIISVQALEPFLVYYPSKTEEDIFNKLIYFILFEKNAGNDYSQLENIINGYGLAMWRYLKIVSP